ncbi:unnamed protein product [Rotaria magnacalcarata]
MTSSSEIIIKMSYNSNNYTKFEYPIGINKTDWIYAQDTLNLNYLKQIFNKLSKNYTNLNVTPTIMMINNDKNFSNNTNMNIKNDYMMFDSNRMFLIIFFLLLLLMLTIVCCLAIAYCIHRIYQKLKQRRCSYTLVHDNNLTLNNSDTNADLDNKRLNVNVKPFKTMLISTYSNLSKKIKQQNNSMKKITNDDDSFL